MSQAFSVYLFAKVLKTKGKVIITPEKCVTSFILQRLNKGLKVHIVINMQQLCFSFLVKLNYVCLEEITQQCREVNLKGKKL